MRAAALALALALTAAATATVAAAPSPAAAGEDEVTAEDEGAGDATGGDADADVDADLPAIDRSAPLRPPALVTPSTDEGAEPLAPLPPAGPPVRRSYRAQVIAADAAAIGLSVAVDRISADGSARPDALATLTIATYFFAAPAIHGLHREGRRALMSFGLRASLPLLLGLLGEQIESAPPCDSCNDSLRSQGKVIGLTTGVLLAMALDGALLSRPYYRRAERPRAAWAPAIRAVPGGALAGLGGTF